MQFIFLLYISFFGLSVFAQEVTQMGKYSEFYLKNKVLTSCKGNEYKEYLEDNLVAMLKIPTIFSSKRFFYTTQEIYQILIINKCDPNLILEFKKLLSNDRQSISIQELQQIEKEVLDFRNKGLSASFQLSKYSNFKNDNFILNYSDRPEIKKLLEQNSLLSEARKKTCTNVVNIKEPLSLDRPKDQDSIGWCYAYATSDLIANEIGKNPSAVYLSNIVNNQLVWKLFDVREGASIPAAFAAAQSNGICLEKDLPSTDFAFANDSSQLYQLKEAYFQFLELTDKYSKSFIGNREDYTEDNVMTDLCTEHVALRLALQEIFPRVNVLNIARIILKLDGVEAFKQLVDLSCPIVKDDELASLQLKSASGENMFEVMDELLLKGKIVGVNLKSGMLKDYHDNSYFSDHTVSIVGRRFNPKTLTCDYLLRNSWGRSCAAYSRDYECINGHIWIAEDFFKYNNSIDKVFYIEKN